MPPIMQSSFLRLVSSLRGAKFVYYVQDIYPEIALTMEMLRPGIVARLIGALDSFTIDRSDIVLTHTADMAQTLLRRSKPKRLSMMNNFAMVQTEPGPAPERTGPCRFVFAGNIGRFQNLDRLVDLFSDVDPSVAVLELLGEGRVKSALQEKVASERIASVRFHPIVSPTEAAEFIRQCDVGVISLDEELYRYCYPSKTFTYLSVGVPVLALLESSSELGREIVGRSLGVAIDWSAPREIQLRKIRELCDNHRVLRPYVYQRSVELFDREGARQRWLKVFAEIE